MDSDAFGALFDRCKPFITDTGRDQREVLAIALHWIGTAAMCRSQEVLLDLAYSTVHKYRMRGIRAIVQALHDTMVIPSTVPDFFATKDAYSDQAIGAIDGVTFELRWLWRM
ncbi:hypothetical protein JG687_00001723 [Phytophthora cactorum]|uniref:Uncharacterized protein n=1 Tax=Phytophthora cactorum TaxID=29920 RepID=A0A8T1UYY5_9STRA|nr:hypothetical protein GQ600_18082 [Phytophthora cactorum]KAG6971947.1 hypothetical protein JG687_00001723 [Phytophthora cactorum]